MRPPDTAFTLRHVRVLQQDGGFSDPTDLTVEEGVISRVGSGAVAPPGTLEYDFAGLWLMPGVFDCHAHVGISTVDEGELLRTPPSYALLETTVNLRNVLDSGVTFVRDLGGLDAGVRRAVDEGVIAGPRLQVAIKLLSQTGGHGDAYSERIGLEPNPILGDILATADGVEGVRLAVRRLLRAGADCIKVCTSGGVLSPHDSPWDTSFTTEEIATAVFEAGRRGRPVASHASAGQGISAAVAAGVRSVEHGTLLTEEQAAAMAAAGCWLVPTLCVLHELLEAAKPDADAGWAVPPHALPKIRELEELYGACVPIARDAGVRIATGCDWGDRRQHGRNLEEIALLHEVGMPVEEALLAATASGAELCGVADRYGSVAPGYVFDAVVLADDPSDVSVFRRPEAVREVFKAGVPCKTGGDLLAERGSAALRTASRKAD
jgi:imidazolonepropionase-like amidohydrolase